jgi:hypothetical protein
MYILSSSIVLSSDFTYMLQCMYTDSRTVFSRAMGTVQYSRGTASSCIRGHPPPSTILYSPPCNNNNTQTSKLKSQVWPPRSVPNPPPSPPSPHLTYPSSTSKFQAIVFLSVFNFLSTISRFVVQTRHLRKQLVPFLVYLTIRT